MKWADSTTASIFSDIEKDYVRVSCDNYVKKEAFTLDESVVKQIETAIRGRFQMGFAALNCISDWKDFPVLKYEWNCFLLRSVIDMYIPTLKVIESSVKDRRYEKGAVMDIHNSTNDYPTLVSNYLKANNVTEISENKLRTFLTEKGLTMQNIPRELYSCEQMTIRMKGSRLIKAPAA